MENQAKVYVERAAGLHANGHNCAQAVAVAFADDVGIDQNALFRISEAFGRGMGNTEGTCGAISGALMILSQLSSGGDPGNVTKTATYASGAQLYDRFVQETGSAKCSDLQGLESGTPLCSCETCIQEATGILYDILKEKGV